MDHHTASRFGPYANATGARADGPPQRPGWRARGAVAAVALGLAAACAGAAGPASAAGLPTADYACWADLGTGARLCVDRGVDLVAAVARERGVLLTVPDGAIPGSLPASARSASTGAATAGTAALASTVISVIYDNSGYGGGSYSLSISSGCGWGVASLGAIGWNDRASSYRSFNGCTTALYSNENYAGSSTGYTTNASGLGGLNDQASSWSVH
ncbi:hypothetical protein [Cryobacterium sp. PAMC25264]|uniref:hypothetical protein n=1 Tax=Cryobacterium sp. PAMC25264 TaxID=2861288 RepID=UPI001C632343|nr:hypothetical protein [Cryobacterium sp. PAMC25264]QYF74994.1 hypothetical protein KY500_07735 [Cryobacterium sp. PAMC25264]